MSSKVTKSTCVHHFVAEDTIPMLFDTMFFGTGAWCNGGGPKMFQRQCRLSISVLHCLARNIAWLQQVVGLIGEIEMCAGCGVQTRIRVTKWQNWFLVCFMSFGQQYCADSAGDKFER